MGVLLSETVGMGMRDERQAENTSYILQIPTLRALEINTNENPRIRGRRYAD